MLEFQGWKGLLGRVQNGQGGKGPGDCAGSRMHTGHSSRCQNGSQAEEGDPSSPLGPKSVA